MAEGSNKSRGCRFLAQLRWITKRAVYNRIGRCLAKYHRLCPRWTKKFIATIVIIFQFILHAYRVEQIFGEIGSQLYIHC